MWEALLALLSAPFIQLCIVLILGAVWFTSRNEKKEQR